VNFLFLRDEERDVRSLDLDEEGFLISHFHSILPISQSPKQPEQG
jgi:hypothetical protein